MMMRHLSELQLPSQILLALLALSALSHPAGSSAGSDLTLPVSRIPFVAPTWPASAVSSYQVFNRSGVFQLANSSLAAGRPDAAYCINLVIGTPGQNVTSLLDTGSSDLVVAGKSAPTLARWFHAEASNSLAWLQQLVRRPYAIGFWEGHLASDLVSVTGGARPARVAFTVAERSSAFFDLGGGGAWQAAVGLAFDRLASAQAPAGSGGNFADALARQLLGGGDGAPAVFAMQLCGGWADSSFISVGRGNRAGMVYAAVRWDWFYEVVIVDVKLNNFSLGMDCKEYNFDKAILHSGVGDIRLPPRVHSRIAQQLGMQLPQLGNQFFNGLSLLCTSGADGGNSSAQLLRSFPSITFSLLASDNQTIDLSLSPAQYLRQVAGSSLPGNSSCYRFGVQSSTTGTVLGSAFLSGFLVEFDRAGMRVGFGRSTCGDVIAGLSPSRVSGPTPFAGGWDCAFFRDVNAVPNAVLRPAAVAMAIVSVMCVLPVCALLAWRQTRRPAGCRGRQDDDEGETVQLVPA